MEAVESFNIYLHDGHVVRSIERDVVQLGDEDRGHGDEQGGAVHVDGGSDGHHELPDAPVHSGSVEALESDWQRGSPEYCLIFRKSLLGFFRLTLMP